MPRPSGTPVNRPHYAEPAPPDRVGCLRLGARPPLPERLRALRRLRAVRGLLPHAGGSSIFLNPENLLNVLRFASENGIIAIGMTLVILTGGIDLSVGALLALCAVGAAAAMMRMSQGTPAAVALVLGIGALAGLINGLVTTQLRIQSFITTLAMMSVARGVASLWSGGYAIPLAYGPRGGAARLQEPVRRRNPSARNRTARPDPLLPGRRAPRLVGTAEHRVSGGESTPWAAASARPISRASP